MQNESPRPDQVAWPSSSPTPTNYKDLTTSPHKTTFSTLLPDNQLTSPNVTLHKVLRGRPKPTANDGTSFILQTNFAFSKTTSQKTKSTHYKCDPPTSMPSQLKFYNKKYKNPSKPSPSDLSHPARLSSPFSPKLTRLTIPRRPTFLFP